MAHLTLTDYYSNLKDNTNLKKCDKYVALSKLSIDYIWENIKMSYKNNKFKIFSLTWNGEFELPDRSYFVSDIQYYFEYKLKKHGEKTDNPSIRTYINKIEKRITLKIKTGNCLKFLTPETMKLLGSTKSKITKDAMVKIFLI